MSLLTIRPGETRVGRDEVEQYMVRGHWGYVLDYRREHGGRDPDPKMLDELVRKAGVQLHRGTPAAPAQAATGPADAKVDLREQAVLAAANRDKSLADVIMGRLIAKGTVKIEQPASGATQPDHQRQVLQRPACHAIRQLQGALFLGVDGEAAAGAGDSGAAGDCALPAG